MTLNGNLTRVVEDSYSKIENGQPVTDEAGKPVMVHVKLVVAEADVLIATRRYRLQNEALKFYGFPLTAQPPYNPPEGVDPDEFDLRLLTYPNLISATVSAEGIPWPLPFADFTHVRQILWDRWTEAVMALNPQWYGKREAADPNALTPSTSASPAT